MLPSLPRPLIPPPDKLTQVTLNPQSEDFYSCLIAKSKTTSYILLRIRWCLHFRCFRKRPKDESPQHFNSPLIELLNVNTARVKPSTEYSVVLLCTSRSKCPAPFMFDSQGVFLFATGNYDWNNAFGKLSRYCSFKQSHIWVLKLGTIQSLQQIFNMLLFPDTNIYRHGRFKDCMMIHYILMYGIISLLFLSFVHVPLSYNVREEEDCTRKESRSRNK